MSNIIIKKLESKIFDSSNEALDRLNDLGRNDIDSEAYKDLADQVRSTCPCNCYFSTRKRYKVDVECTYKGSGSYGIESDGVYSEQSSTNEDIILTGTGYIEKGSTSGTIACDSKFNSLYDSLGYYGCPDTVSFNQTVSIKLSDDCKKWIFNFTPSFKGKVHAEGSTECFEHSKNALGSDKLKEETYPDVTSAYPSGTMTLQYESIYYDRSQTGETRFEIYDNKTYQIVKVTVTPVDDNNTLNLINSLYSDLDENLTKEQ